MFKELKTMMSKEVMERVRKLSHHLEKKKMTQQKQKRTRRRRGGKEEEETNFLELKKTITENKNSLQGLVMQSDYIKNQQFQMIREGKTNKLQNDQCEDTEIQLGN